MGQKSHYDGPLGVQTQSLHSRSEDTRLGSITFVRFFPNLIMKCFGLILHILLAFNAFYSSPVLHGVISLFVIFGAALI